MRIKLIVSYNGSTFNGSQIQTTTPNTIMGVLQSVLNRLGITAVAIASGRTDKGVHALRQIIHCDLPPFWHDISKLKKSLSHQLPASITIRHIEPTTQNFHARYSAKRRVYRYILSDSAPNPFQAELITFVPQLNFQKISAAIVLFKGEHDFQYFKKNGSEVTHYTRYIYKAFAYQHRGYTVLVFEANGYLRSQIRLMVGFLLQISGGKLTQNQLKEQLALKQLHSSYLAPHYGLYLANIIY